MSQTAPEKNQHARRNCPAIPAAAAIATTVRPAGQDHPARQRHEQRVGGAAPECRASSSSRSRQAGARRALPPGHRHTRAARRPRPRAIRPPARHRPGRGTSWQTGQSGSLTESDDLESHPSYGASLLLSRRHAPGCQIVICYHQQRSESHEKLQNARWRHTAASHAPGTSSARSAPPMPPAKRLSANRRRRAPPAGRNSETRGACQSQDVCARACPSQRSVSASSGAAFSCANSRRASVSACSVPGSLSARRHRPRPSSAWPCSRTWP